MITKAAWKTKLKGAQADKRGLADALYVWMAQTGKTHIEATPVADYLTPAQGRRWRKREHQLLARQRKAL